jgi:hypothetical protein
MMRIQMTVLRTRPASAQVVAIMAVVLVQAAAAVILVIVVVAAAATMAAILARWVGFGTLTLLDVSLLMLVV